MHFQCWSFRHQSQKYGHVPSMRHHSVSCGQLFAFTSWIKQCIFQRYLFVSFRRTYYGHILSHVPNELLGYNPRKIIIETPSVYPTGATLTMKIELPSPEPNRGPSNYSSFYPSNDTTQKTIKAKRRDPSTNPVSYPDALKWGSQ